MILDPRFPNFSIEDNAAVGVAEKKFPLADDEKIAALVAKDKGSIPVEDFFQNPERTSFTISPNGKFLAYLGPYEERLNLFVQEIGSTATQRITSRTDRDIPGYFWADDEHLVYMQDFGGDENFHIFLAKRDGSDEKDLTPFEGVKAQIIDDLEDRPDEMIVGLNKRNPQLFEPYRLNFKTGELTLLAENSDPMNPIVGWLTDHEGKIRAATRMSDGINASLLYRETEQEEFKVVVTNNFKSSLNPLFFTFDNRQLYCSSNIGRDKEAIIRFDPVAGKEVELLYEDADNDVSSLHYSHKRKVLTGITYTSWKRQVVFLDKETEAIYNQLYQLLPQYEVVTVDTDKEESRYIVRTYSDRSLGAFYLYEKATGQLTKLADVKAGLKEEQLAEMKPITYTSRDGLTIHGYLTLPVGREAKNLPVVVNPHGGPWARDSWGFNPEIQFLANRGYAVFQMNFRGSVGFGRKFWEASFKKWGKEMQNDITDGVQWLISQGIADPNRIAIYGGSYGGYATLAGVAFTPDLYRCAIDYVGVSNLFTFMETIPPYWKPYLDMMYEMVGHPENDKEAMVAASPVYHVDKIKAPLFIVQGAKDPRVNIDESDQIVKALRARGVEVPYLVKENEGHGFRNQENRYEFYKAMSGFLSKYLG
ncbi:MAG: S9 family peptidase [Chitinophagales bacterium]|nr:S9 family peptidase [Chitinophagales bacterium]